MRLAAHTYAFRDRLLPDALDEVVGLGFDAIELWIGHVDGDVSRAARAVAERELDVVAVCAGGIYDARSPVVAPAAELADAVGTNRIVATVLPDVLERTLARLPAGVVLYVENHWDQPLARPRDVLRALAPHDRALACLDTGHSLLAGVEPDRFAASLGSRLGHIHLKDSRRRTNLERVLGRKLRKRLLPRPEPGSGADPGLDLRLLRRALAVQGFAGAVSFEHEGHDAHAALGALAAAWADAAPGPPAADRTRLSHSRTPDQGRARERQPLRTVVRMGEPSATVAATEPALRVDVPFVDVGAMHAPLRRRILDELAAVVDSSAFTNGPAVAAFEQAFAAYCGSPLCVGVASGLDALRLGLIAAGLEPGDEVIVPANTFVATLEAVEQAGGTPVVVDVSEADYNMDAEAAAAAIGPRTRCLLPVHLYGQLADVTTLGRLAGKRGLMLIEDACQAHGAERDGRRAGAVGIVGAFSFYPSKNLGAIGDAGALVTPDGDVAARARMLREHGQTSKYDHGIPGYTSRLDTVQAAVLGAKLPELDRWNASRRTAAARYTEALRDVGDLRTPPVPAGSSPVWHLYPVRTADPDALGRFLADRGIRTGRHYPVPVHLTDAYAHLGRRRGDFPVAERLAAELLSLPMFPGISEEQLEAVVTGVADYFAAR